MDICVGTRTVSVPAEVFDIIVGFVEHDKPSLLNIRLVSRLLRDCATKRLLAKPSVPAEVFTPAYLDLPVNALDERYDRAGGRPIITIWTWTRLPTNIEFTEDLVDLLCAQVKRQRPSSSGALGGRVGTTWGRTHEDPELVVFLTQFHDEEALLKYRSSQQAKDLREYLEKIASGYLEIASGCLETSSSTRWLLPPPHRNQQQILGTPYAEIRTVFFKADMTREQRALIDQSRTIENWPKAKYLPPAEPGHTTWAWLPGFYMHNGQLAIAARYLLRWTSEEKKAALTGAEARRREFDGRILSTVQNFEYELDQAGRIGQESYHCKLQSGPSRV